MRKRDILSILITVALLTMSLVGFAQQPKVYYYKIDDNISKPALRLTEKAVKEAEAGKFDYLMLELNTFGGELDAADKIRTLLLNTTVGEIMPDKYQSYMRSLMRTTAEHNGRNPNIAQAMVDPDVVVPGVSEKGKVLTLTSEEAAKNGFCESVVNNREEALSYVSETPAEITEQELSVIDKIINFLVNPVVSGILIMCIVGGLYFELQAPGIGLPSVIAITAALLFFAPHYLEGLAAHWEILIFLAGLVLLMLEFFVVPGFGVTGISGIVLILASLVLTLVFNVGFKFNFNPEFNASAYVSKMTILVLVSSLAGFFLALWLGKKLILAETRFGSLALRTGLESDKGFTSQDMRNEQYVGKEGVAQTILRPSGKINIDGEVLDATVEHGYVEAGEAVTVTKFENAQLFVRKKI